MPFEMPPNFITSGGAITDDSVFIPDERSAHNLRANANVNEPTHE